jgi:hypothetical protein
MYCIRSQVSASNGCVLRCKTLAHRFRLQCLWYPHLTWQPQVSVDCSEKLQSRLFYASIVTCSAGLAGETLRSALLASAAPVPVAIAGADGCSHASVIILAGDIKWPQLGAVPLFVRHFYEGCCVGPLQSFTADPRAKYRKIIILGNPGIGKSAFGCYLLWRLIRERRTVVYMSDKHPHAWIFHAHGEVQPFMAEQVKLIAALGDPGTIFIADSIEGGPPAVEAFTIVLSSPKRSRWKELHKKDDAIRLFFPVYSWIEIQELSSVGFPSSAENTPAGVRDRYVRWGGVPRYVLAKLDPDSQGMLDSAITSLDLDSLAAFLGKNELETDEGISHRLLHLKTRGETMKVGVDGEMEDALLPSAWEFYELARTELASDYAADSVYLALRQHASDKLRALLDGPPSNSSITTFFGAVYERYVLEMLATCGGTFRRRLMQANGKGVEDTIVVAPGMGEKRFTTLADLRALTSLMGQPPAVLRPVSKNFCAVDGVLPDHTPFNVTINKLHTLDLTGSDDSDTSRGLLSVAEAMVAGGIADGAGVPAAKHSGDILFYWIVPSYVFEQSMKTPRGMRKGGRAVQRGDSDATRVIQYAVEVQYAQPQRAAISSASAASSTAAS